MQACNAGVSPTYQQPSYWQFPADPPPEYDEMDPLQIEAGEDKDEEDEGRGTEDVEDVGEANKILDHFRSTKL